MTKLIEVRLLKLEDKKAAVRRFMKTLDGTEMDSETAGIYHSIRGYYFKKDIPAAMAKIQDFLMTLAVGSITVVEQLLLGMEGARSLGNRLKQSLRELVQVVTNIILLVRLGGVG